MTQTKSPTLMIGEHLSLLINKNIINMTTVNHKHSRSILHSQEIISYPYAEFGIKGVGKNKIPILSMDDYIDQSRNLELHIESCKGLALAEDIKMGMVYGALPPEEVKRFSGHDCWSEMLRDINRYDPQGIHQAALKEIIDKSPGKEMQAMYKYAYFAMGAVIPWFFALYLKKNDFRKKTEDAGNWTDSSKYFPNIIKYVETLPFKHVGRILYFTSYPNAGVVIHRDSIVSDHKDHNINLFFDGGWRPSFIWDEVKKEKIYLPSGAKSYFFNNRDYHGVDPEPVFRYTLRVDGTFTDELCEKLGLVDGYTWQQSY
jgi:hypothetical protein